MTNAAKLVGQKRDQSAKVKREANPYKFPNDGQLLAYWQYRNSAPQPPDTWRIRHTWIDEEEPREEGKRDASTGLIKELRESSVQSSFSKSRYVRDIRLLATWRLLVGRKRDGCIQLDQQLDIEHQKYLDVKRDYKECVNALEEFLSRDHEESMRVLSLAEAELSLTSELSERRDELSRRYGQARLEVYHWEEAWRTVRACHRFLHRVSPLANLAEDDDEKFDDDEAQRDDDTQQDTSVLADKTAASLNDVGNATSLDSIIAAFENESSGLSKSSAKDPSELGLLEANDLLRLFRDVEQQNLNGLIHLEALGGPMADMISRINVAEVQVNHEIDDVLESIKQLETAIEREERRAERLERKASLMVQRQFRALICSEEALRARVLVEEAYESCVEPNEAGLDPLAMARGLESAYERLSAELDGLPRNLVVACERDGFRQEMRESREAEEAAKKFELMHRLLAALRRIMEQTKEPKRRTLMRRSKPRLKMKHKLKKNDNLASTKQGPDQIGSICRKMKDADDDSSDDQN